LPVRAPIAAVLLDFDGLILDTETPIFEAWRTAFREHGQELSLDDWQHTLGTNGGFEPMTRLAELTQGAIDRQAVEGRVQEANRAGCDALLLLPGVERLLADAESLGLRRAVASSSPRAWVEGWLTRHGIRERIEAVCSRDDVARVKPAPDLFLLAAERLGIPPAACLVFEDSPNGMRAARAAGMRCVAVTNGLTRQLALPDPDLVMGSLAERPLAAILAALA
jgi:beta-phosphoglucomutase-like phosphatase (HAD superfamily)